jgi:hypothetical protein
VQNKHRNFILTVTFFNLLRFTLLNRKVIMLRKILNCCVICLLSVVSAHAQNLVYDANAEIRTVGNFTGVDVGSGINLYLSQGKEQAIAVSAGDKQDVPKIKTEVKNGVLHIKVDNGFWNGWNWGNKKLKAYVTVTTLDYLDVSGGSIAKAADPINTNSLSVEVSGGGILEGTFNGNVLKIDLSGGSISKIDGHFDNANIEASGGSIFKEYDMQTNTCKVDASGGSIVSITVNKDLKVDASGGSIIRYKGTCTISDIDLSGGSSVKRKED